VGEWDRLLQRVFADDYYSDDEDDQDDEARSLEQRYDAEEANNEAET